MPDDLVDEIKRRIDILDLVQGYVELKRAGISWKGLCPFHQEKTPSFTVNQERQSWHCFGCQIGGDIFTFIEKIENVDFKEALELLAGRVGLEVKPQTPKERQQKGEKAKLEELYTLATRFYHELLLNHQVAEPARAYLAKRGVNEASVVAWQLGFAPDRWDALLSALAKRGFSADELLQAGLATRNDKGSIYDRFRNRLLFPVMTASGRPVAFSGRALSDDQQPKYLNSPETALYKKSAVVMGLNLAKEAIRHENEVIVVEGNLDVLMAHQYDVTNTVATGGTALTAEHLALLGRYTEHIVFAFDPDEAGQKAAYKAALLALELQLSPRFLRLPAGEDPDQVLRRDANLFRQAVREAEPAVQYFLRQAIEQQGTATALAKKAIGQQVVPLLKRLSDPIERADSLRSVADRLKVPRASLEAALGQQTAQRAARVPVLSQAKPSGERALTPAQFLMGLLMLFERPVPPFPDTLANSPDKTLRFLGDRRAEGIGQTKSWADWQNSQPQAVQERLSSLLTVAAETYGELDPADVEAESMLLLQTLARRAKVVSQQSRQAEIRVAEQSGDKARVRELLRQLMAEVAESPTSRQNE